MSNINKNSILFRDEIFKFLFLSSIVFFGVFGQLGFFLLTLATLFALFSNRLKTWDFKRGKVFFYFSISSIYLIYFLRSIQEASILDVFWEMGPLLPLAALPLLVFLSPFDKILLPAKLIGRLASASTILAFFYFFIGDLYPESLKALGLKNTINARYEALHGNPVPFSIVILSLGIMSLIGWRQETLLFRFSSTLSFMWSVFVVVFYSQVRSMTLVSIILAIAIAIAIAIASRINKRRVLILIGFVGVIISSQSIWTDYLNFPKRSFQIFDIVLSEKLNSSDRARVAMWNAGYKSFQEKPLVGSGYFDRFSPLLAESSPRMIKHYKHLHNDVISGLVISGVLGGLGVLVLLASPIVAWALLNRTSKEALYLALSLTIIFYAAGLSNTILFNDVTPAWLVLCSLLVAKIKKIYVS